MSLHDLSVWGALKYLYIVYIVYHVHIPSVMMWNMNANLIELFAVVSRIFLCFHSSKLCTVLCCFVIHYCTFVAVHHLRDSAEHLKPGFHYPSSRAELTRVLGCIFWHPSTRAVNSGVKKCTRVHGPSARPVNSGSGNRALVYCTALAVGMSGNWKWITGRLTVQYNIRSLSRWQNAWSTMKIKYTRNTFCGTRVSVPLLQK